MKKKAGYRLTDVDDVHAAMPPVQVPYEPTVDEGELGQDTDDDTNREDPGDKNREDQELPEAVWGLIRAGV